LPSVPILELNCFIQGDDPSHIFPIKIARTESVGTLKEFIKTKKVTLEHVDADSLRLWDISIPYDNTFKETLRKVELIDEKQLSAFDNLASIFPNLPANSLHIIVKPPISKLLLIIITGRLNSMSLLQVYCLR
jgi:hypothetical protein